MQKVRWEYVDLKAGAHLADLQKPWRRIRARARLDDVRIHDRGADLRPGLQPPPDDREAARPHAGADHSAVCTPRNRICESVWFACRRLHRSAYRSWRAVIGRLRHTFTNKVLAPRLDTIVVAGYIDGFYNPVRRHSTLDFTSPVKFEAEAMQTV